MTAVGILIIFVSSIFFATRTDGFPQGTDSEEQTNILNTTLQTQKPQINSNTTNLPIARPFKLVTPTTPFKIQQRVFETIPMGTSVEVATSSITTVGDKMPPNASDPTSKLRLSMTPSTVADQPTMTNVTNVDTNNDTLYVDVVVHDEGGDTLVDGKEAEITTDLGAEGLHWMMLTKTIRVNKVEEITEDWVNQKKRSIITEDRVEQIQFTRKDQTVELESDDDFFRHILSLQN